MTNQPNLEIVRLPTGRVSHLLLDGDICTIREVADQFGLSKVALQKRIAHVQQGVMTHDQLLVPLKPRGPNKPKAESAEQRFIREHNWAMKNFKLNVDS